MKYTKKELKALKAFGEYIWCEVPYQEMEPRVYKKLGKYYHDLPKEVFSVPKCNSLYHVSRPERTEKKLTDSGIVSCTTPKGKRYIQEKWCLKHGDIWWRLKRRKAVDARKLLKAVCEAGLLNTTGAWLEKRVNNEDEYILPLERVEVVSKKVVK